MDWKRLDRARSSVGPIELDLIESYAQGKVSRRDFVKRGSIIGLTMPFMGAIIAACGSDDDGGSSGGTTPATNAPSTEAGGGGDGGGGSATSGGTVVWANQQGDANSGLDPVNMLDLGTYNVCSQSFEYLVGLGAGRQHRDNGPRHRLGAQRRRVRVDVQPPAGRQVAGRQRLHVRRRRCHDGSPRRGRATPVSPASSTSDPSTRPTRSSPSSR